MADIEEKLNLGDKLARRLFRSRDKHDQELAMAWALFSRACLTEEERKWLAKRKIDPEFAKALADSNG